MVLCLRCSSRSSRRARLSRRSRSVLISVPRCPAAARRRSSSSRSPAPVAQRQRRPPSPTSWRSPWWRRRSTPVPSPWWWTHPATAVRWPKHRAPRHSSAAPNRRSLTEPSAASRAKSWTSYRCFYLVLVLLYKYLNILESRCIYLTR